MAETDGPRFLTSAPAPVPAPATPVSGAGPFRQAQSRAPSLDELRGEAEARAARESRASQPPPMPYPMPAPTYVHGERGPMILAFGILALVVCTVFGPIAWSMGNEELRRIDAGETPPMQRGSVQAGRICGIIASVMLMIAGGFLLFAFVIVGML